MKSCISSAIALCMLTATSILSTEASAADLPARRSPPVFTPIMVPVFTWTGLYVGADVGYEFGRSTAFASNPVLGGLAANSGSPRGLIGGAHVGYNFSTQSIFGLNGLLGTGGVFGVEGDVDGSNYRSIYVLGGINDRRSQQLQGSVRGRLGFALDRTLFYATGGVAFGGLRNQYVNTFTNASDTKDNTRVGYTIGGGVEYGLTNSISVRAEYRYTDFGSFTDNLGVSTGGSVNVRHRETDNRVLAGFSYKLDLLAPAAPVVARY